MKNIKLNIYLQKKKCEKKKKSLFKKKKGIKK